MPKVICTRPNASLCINGVKFTPTEDGTGVISEEISDEAAEHFLLVPGYDLAETGEQKPAAPVKTTLPAKAPAAPAKPATVKKAEKAPAAPAPAPAAAPAAAPEGNTDAAKDAAAGDAAAKGADDATTGSQDTTPGAGEGGGSEDPNVF